jgi:hypothetical protein
MMTVVEERWMRLMKKWRKIREKRRKDSKYSARVLIIFTRGPFSYYYELEKTEREEREKGRE